MSKDARKKCGRRLLAARSALGLTQDALGKLIDVDQVTISRWENGNRMPSFEARILLVEALGSDPFAIEVNTADEAVA